MSVIIEDKNGGSLQMIAWNWGVLHYTLVTGEVLSLETLEPVVYQNSLETFWVRCRDS